MPNFFLFKGKGARDENAPGLPLHEAAKDNPEQYLADDGLIHAVNDAIALGRPLLLTGDPGSGKTQLAYRLAYELTPKLPEPLRFQVTSRSESTDLFYHYDALRHFQDVNIRKGEVGAIEPPPKPVDIWNYIRIRALGQAILRATADRPRANRLLPPELQTAEPVRTITLIDEIDKAPRDLPNDILAEIEGMEFAIRETGDTFKAGHEYRPVVILTSNSERDLPDAFLRRCVYYHIPPPTETRLREIVEKRVPETSAYSPARWKQTFERFEQVRKELSKKQPGTDELIAWIRILHDRGIDLSQELSAAQKEELNRTYSTLAKDSKDLARAQKLK